MLADGTRAVAWTDGNETSEPPCTGRVDYAVEGAAATPATPAPSVTVGAPRDRSLRPAEDLVLPVHCSAACDLRATAGKYGANVTAALERAGTVRLRFSAFTGALAPAHGTLTVRLESSAPGARTARTRTVHVQLQRRLRRRRFRGSRTSGSAGRGRRRRRALEHRLPARLTCTSYVYGSRDRSYRNDPVI